MKRTLAVAVMLIVSCQTVHADVRWRFLATSALSLAGSYVMAQEAQRAGERHDAAVTEMWVQTDLGGWATVPGEAGRSKRKRHQKNLSQALHAGSLFLAGLGTTAGLTAVAISIDKDRVSLEREWRF